MTPAKSEDRFQKPTGYPVLVRFRDINDPRTLERVDPEGLSTSFGTGVRLARVTLQLTDDHVTTGIEKKLKWLNNLSAFRSDPTNPFTSTLPREISKLRTPA
jgi:hypothetical protein